MITEMLKERLVHQLKEELQDAINYHTLAKDVHKENKRAAIYLFSIMRDERDHAEAIYEILEDNGWDIGECPEAVMLWERMEELDE